MIAPNMPYDEYRAAEGLNYSFLKWGDDSMLKLKSKAGDSSKASAAQDFGSVAHLMFLEPKKLACSVALWTGRELKSGKNKGDITTEKKGAEWDAFEVENENRYIITQGQQDALQRMKVRLYADSNIMALLDGAQTELSIFWDSPKYGRGKGRIDILTANRAAYDYKTCADLSRFTRDLFRFKYHLQCGWYVTGLEANDIRTADYPFGWIVQETEPPYDCAIFHAGFDVVEYGQKRMDSIAENWTICEKANDYSGMFAGPQVVGLPRYMQEVEDWTIGD